MALLCVESFARVQSLEDTLLIIEWSMTKDIELNKITEAYYGSRARLIILDYDGTLVPSELNSEPIKTDSKLTALLYSMTCDPKNSVVLISGRDKKYLDSRWPNPPMTIVAEHGGFYKNKNESWREMFSVSPDWIPKTVVALEALALRYDGSFVEEKAYSIVWNYRSIKEKLSEGEKRQILAAIRTLPERRHFRICDCEFAIELRTVGIQKGAFTSLWTSNQYYDFILAIGDGQTDEDLFKILDKTAYSIRVGRSNSSEAVYHLASQTDVLPFLQSILDFGSEVGKTKIEGFGSKESELERNY
jgi:trehalose 6-phosphate synthase/phosphatase